MTKMQEKLYRGDDLIGRNVSSLSPPLFLFVCPHPSFHLPPPPAVVTAELLLQLLPKAQSLEPWCAAYPNS